MRHLFKKNSYYTFFIGLILILITSCQEQDVISNLRADLATIEVSVQNDGNFGLIQKGEAREIKIVLKNLSENMPIRKLVFPADADIKKDSLYYIGAAPYRGAEKLNRSFINWLENSKLSADQESTNETEKNSINWHNLSIEEIVERDLEAPPLTIPQTSREFLCNNEIKEGGHCEFNLTIFSNNKTEVFYPFIISYNDGINQHSLQINLTGAVSDPGEVYYTTIPHSIYEEYLNAFNENKDNVNKAKLKEENNRFDKSNDFSMGFESLDFELTAFGTEKRKLVYIFNYGERDIQIFNAHFSNIDSPYFNFSGGKYPGLEGTCTQIVSPQKVCTIEVSFFPIAPIDPVGFNGESYMDRLTLFYTDSLIKKELIIVMAGVAKEERGRISIVRPTNNAPLAGCLTPTGQTCLSLGNFPIGLSQDFTVSVENVGIIEAKLSPPIIKVEPLGFDSIFVDFNSPLNNHIEWHGFNQTQEKGGLLPCSEIIKAKERCNLFFSYHTYPMDLNPENIYFGELSRLISFEYSDNDVVNPVNRMAYVIGAEKKIQEEGEEIYNRINIIANIVKLGEIDITSVLADDLYEQLETKFLKHERIYNFPPQEIAPKSPKKVKFTFKNSGAFEIKDITLVTKNISSNAFEFNMEKCPSHLSPNSDKVCEVIATAKSNMKGVFEEEFSLKFNDGIKESEIELIKLQASFSNSANLSFEQYVANLSGIYQNKSTFNSNFPLSYESPLLRIDIVNKGNGEAVIKELKTPLEAICDGSHSVPITFSNLPETNCKESTTIYPQTGAEKNNCSIFFTFKLDEQSIPPEVTGAISCYLVFKLKYDDELSTSKSNYLKSEGLTIEAMETIYSREVSFNFKTGEGPNLIALNNDDYRQLITISESSQKVTFLDSITPPLLDFGKNALGFPVTKEFTFFNIGQISASNPNAFINENPLFNFVEPACFTQSIGANYACSAKITYTPVSSGAHEETLHMSFENSAQEISKNYQVIATGGNYGYLTALDQGDNNLIDNRVIDFGKFVVHTRQQLSVTFKNVGQEKIEGVTFSDNTKTINKVTDEEGVIQEIVKIDETKIMNTNSSCLAPDLILEPNDSCEIIYDVIIAESGPASIRINVSYHNPDEQKAYYSFINYRGETPPDIRPNYSGKDFPISYDYEEISVGLSKEKRFDFTNAGQSDAENFSVEITDDQNRFFNIFYDTCNGLEKRLDSGNTCSIKVRYSPIEVSDFILDTEDNTKIYTPHSAKIKVTYDPIIDKLESTGPENTQPFYPPYFIDLSGYSVVPPSQFSHYTDIRVVNNAGNTTIDFSWASFKPEDRDVVIDSYLIYMSEDEPLPKNIDLLNSQFLYKTINENTTASRKISISDNFQPGKKLFFTIRSSYLGNILEIEESELAQNPWDLKVIVPPKNMGLIHPFISNDITCKEMKIRPNFEDAINQENASLLIEPLPSPKSINFSCPTEKVENDNFIPGESQYIYSYYDSGQFLFVDLYELSETSNGSSFISTKGEIPKEFTIPTAASQACTSIHEEMNGFSINKRLLSRKEWFAAASWSPSLSNSKINKIEKGDNPNTDCYYNSELVPKPSGVRSNCQSRFGMYDMAGNVWEWNSNQVNVIIGLDDLLGEYLLIPGGASVQFPAEIPCYDFIHGIGRLESSINGSSVCVKSIPGKQIPAINSSYYFPPNPMNNKVKNIRSGGGVGERVGMTSNLIKKVGRFVVDLDSYTGMGTGTRCGFTIPYSSN